MKRNQRGFAFLEAVILVLAVALLGVAGSYVWHRQPHNNPYVKPATTALHSVLQSVIPADWLTYKSTHTPIQFSYPGGWKVAHGQEIGTTLENITLSGPNSFSMRFFLEKQHSPRIQNFMCVAPQVQTSMPINNNYVMILDGVESVFLQNINSKNLISARCGTKLNIAASQTDFTFYGSYPSGTYNNLTTDSYMKLPEIVIAKTIFSTFTQ